jgi:thiol:disulfide interchange protein/DsbC/DsbD-like thiol-disulfide interchange protein
MTRSPLRVFFFVVFALMFAGAANGQAVRTDNVEAQLHASHSGIIAGERVTVVLRLKMREGWHTYWRNAGDSGEATEISWELPPGFQAGPIQWPTPHPLPVGPITNYGFEGEILLPVELQAPATLASGDLEISARARWLVCSDVCIPEEAKLHLPLRGGESRIDPIWAPQIAQTLAALPRALQTPAHLTRNADGAARLTGSVPQWQGKKLRTLYFFPYARDQIDHAAAQAFRAKGGEFSLTLQPQPNGLLGTEPISGVLSAEVETPKGKRDEAVEITASLGDALAPAAASAPASGGQTLGLGGAMLFAFLGGLILNIMPCVFPVLSIKALSFATTPATEARRHGMFFLAGVMVTFLALAGLLIGLQAAGAAIGWGFQLQQPLVVAGLALVFFTLGLNLLGAFEIGSSLQGIGSGVAARSGGLGAFATGALAVVAASPCTAPFMGGALGFAATQPPVISMGVFAALGLGFAAPFTLLSFAPALRRLLPKPGAWMARFKELLAFPMLATAIYLAWVLMQQSGANAVLALLSAMLAVGFWVWAWGASRRAVTRFTAGAISLGVLGAAVYGLLPGSAPARSEQAALAAPAHQGAAAWSSAAVDAARQEGKVVLVNFTAAWCVTCKVNEALVFNRPEVAATLQDQKVAYFVGDWTSQDPLIKAELSRHGRQGVPLYVLYRPGVPEPEILPQQLSAEGLIGAIRKS